MHHLRGSVACGVGFALTLCFVGQPYAEERKPETPKGAYDHRVVCAGAAAAAVAQTDMATSSSEQERGEAQKALTNTRDEALSSGGRIGLSEVQVTAEIDRSRASILKRIAQVTDSPDALAKEKQALGETVIRCALVEAIERRERESGAPASGKQ